jgi:adenine-specific DNA glycosylase
MSSLKTQVGGTHYTDMAIQPIEYITRNKMPYMDGNVIKYISRWRNKDGLSDLRKARHYIDMLIEMEISTGNA